MQTPRTPRLSPLPIGNWQSDFGELSSSLSLRAEGSRTAIGNPSRISQRLPQRSQRLSGCIFSPKAFTLVELLVVIGIIAILMGLLFPIIKKVRYAAYAADTKNEISQISNACNAYYTTFHAYPGPLSNSQIEVGTTTTLLTSQLELYAPPASLTVIPGNFSFTGTENLVLGLMGGLRPPDSAKPTAQFPNGLPVFAPTEVGLGPLNLNPLSPGRTPSFFSNGSNYLVWCERPSAGGAVFQNTSYQATDSSGNALNLAQFTDAGQQFAQDSPIPEFVDRYPSPGAMPILYLRARTGAQGVVSDGVILTPPPNKQIAQYQYDLRDIAPYVMPNPNNSNHCIGVAAGQNQNLESIGAFSGSVNNQPTPSANAGVYFVNSSIQPTGANVNYTGRPRAVDMFILISAGPDGIYGTPDDITSFGDVSQ